MGWIWQDKNWPHFEYDASKLHQLEIEFHQNAGRVVGTFQHLGNAEQEILKVELLSQEALSTSMIEGEVLNRESVQSSIRKYLGLKTPFRKVEAKEAGVAEMMVDLYLNFKNKLTHQMLFDWHSMLMNGRRDLDVIGQYRQHEDAMQIVSSNMVNPKVFYEAPPSSVVPAEMQAFIDWYNTELLNSKAMPTLVLAGITHLYFEAIHPFEDGNGRIGRVLAEKVLSERLGWPAMTSITKLIDLNKKAYYDAIQECNNNLRIDSFLLYFATLVVDAQQYTVKMVEFIIKKNLVFQTHKTELNPRQEKVLLRLFEAGLEGFKGGLSASNYQALTRSSPATATRDLQELVNLGILKKTGELRYLRYWLV